MNSRIQNSINRDANEKAREKFKKEGVTEKERIGDFGDDRFTVTKVLGPNSAIFDHVTYQSKAGGKPRIATLGKPVVIDLLTEGMKEGDRLKLDHGYMKILKTVANQLKKDGGKIAKYEKLDIAKLKEKFPNAIEVQTRSVKLPMLVEFKSVGRDTASFRDLVTGELHECKISNLTGDSRKALRNTVKGRN